MNCSEIPSDANDLNIRSKNANFHRRSTCRLCDSREVEIVVPLEPTLLPERYVSSPDDMSDSELYPVDLYMCKQCGHVQILDVVDPEHLWSGYTYHSGQTKGILEHFEDVAENVIASNRLDPVDRLAIDIGSNDGSLLRCFQKRGFTALGIDPAREIALKATESGIETIPDLVSLKLAQKIREERGPALLVTAFNVFGHTDDMMGMADSIHTLLASDGLFVFEISYLMDIIDKMLLGTIFHEHMCHHSLIPMKGFLERHGLEIIDIERVTIQGGSLIGTAQLLGGPRKPTPAVQELLDLEVQRKLDKPESIRKFSERLSALQSKIGQLTNDWQRNGASIAGYGAARSGPTLMAQFKLGKIISCIFDDHFQKVNKFTNGDRIPVLPTDELLKRQPDFVFILAWIHAKKIIASNLEYLKRGGHFVLCCPEVKVVGYEEATHQ